LRWKTTYRRREIIGGPGAALAAALMLGASAGVGYARPVPMGSSTTRISYQTESGPFSASGERNYAGVGPTDATVLVGADNIKLFNSLNEFGRRALVPGAVLANESLITHAFYKIDNSSDYFPGIVEGGDIRLQFEGIHFDQPVTVDESTMMMHVLWNADQVDQLDEFYISVQNHHTAAFPFRDADGFFAVGVFNELPIATVAYDDIDPIVTGNGTDTIGIELTFPYDLLRHFEEYGQVVPSGLPAPHGFLEPYHLHLEYVVTPEPSSLVLLLAGALVAVRRRRR
jgi:hypothetical protein